MCLVSPIHAPEDTADMRKSPSAAQTCSKETAPTVINPKKDNSDCDCNVRNDHGNELEPVSPGFQSVACAQFFSTPELLEMSFLSLSLRDIISATRISVQTNKTIAGSSKLQRALFRKADHSPIVGTAVVRPNPLAAFLAPFLSDPQQDNAPVAVHDGLLLHPNPFVFGPTDGLPFIGQFRLTGFMVDTTNSGVRVQPSLGDMYISRPPISRISVEPRIMGAVRKQWELHVKGGVKVKHLVQFARLVRGGVEDGKWPGWKKVALQLGDGYEVVDEAWK